MVNRLTGFQGSGTAQSELWKAPSLQLQQRSLPISFMQNTWNEGLEVATGLLKLSSPDTALTITYPEFDLVAPTNKKPGCGPERRELKHAYQMVINLLQKERKWAKCSDKVVLCNSAYTGMCQITSEKIHTRLKYILFCCFCPKRNSRSFLKANTPLTKYRALSERRSLSLEYKLPTMPESVSQNVLAEIRYWLNKVTVKTLFTWIFPTTGDTAICHPSEPTHGSRHSSTKINSLPQLPELEYTDFWYIRKKSVFFFKSTS